MDKIVTFPIYNTIEFWLAGSLILYFSGNFFLFLYSRTMINDKDFLVIYKIVYSTIIIIKNIFLSISMIFTVNLGSLKKNDAFLGSDSNTFFH